MEDCAGAFADLLSRRGVRDAHLTSSSMAGWAEAEQAEDRANQLANRD